MSSELVTLVSPTEHLKLSVQKCISYIYYGNILFNRNQMSSNHETSGQDSKSRPKSYDEHLLEIVFEIVEKEFQSNQVVLTSVCQGLSVIFSEVF